MAHYPLYTQNLSLVGVCVKRIGKDHRRLIMFGLNNAQLIGRLGADATISHLTNGGRVANVSIGRVGG